MGLSKKGDVSLSRIELFAFIFSSLRIHGLGLWVAQSIKGLTGTGQDLMVPEFQPRFSLCADSSELGARFRFCASPSLSASRLLTLCLSLSKINKH